MATTCTRCESSGFLNLDQISDDPVVEMGADAILRWIKEHDGHDVSICDCCGDGEGWYGEPGEHYGAGDPAGSFGPYAYNGGLCECN